MMMMIIIIIIIMMMMMMITWWTCPKGARRFSCFAHVGIYFGC